MIRGVGNDVLEVSRMKREIRKKGGGFRDRVFTPGEIAYCQEKQFPERHFAARFAAKEALFKALGKGLRDGLSWREAEVRNGPLGEPRLVLRGKARALARRRGIKRIYLSLAHTRGLALSIVVLES